MTAKNFDARSVNGTIPAGVPAYVKSVTVNGQEQVSRCHFDFYDTFRVGGDIVIELTAEKETVDSCGASVPDSLSTVRLLRRHSPCVETNSYYFRADFQKHDDKS